MGDAHRRDHFRADRRVFESRDHGLDTAVMRPGRNRSINTGSARGVEVHIRRDADTRGARGVDHVHDPLALAPVVLTDELEVVNFGGRAALPGDLDGFPHGILDVIALAAHMCAVDATAARRLARQRDQLGSLRVVHRRINERSGEPDGAFLHRLVGYGAHGGELLQGGLHIGFAQHVGSNFALTDEACDIGGDAVLLQSIEVLTERVPVNWVLQVSLSSRKSFGHLRRKGTHRQLGEDIERNSLFQAADGTPVNEQRLLRVAHHVDETRRDREAMCINFLTPFAGGLRTHIGNPVTVDRKCARVRRTARSIVNLGVTDHEVVWRGTCGARLTRGRTKDCRGGKYQARVCGSLHGRHLRET